MHRAILPTVLFVVAAPAQRALTVGKPRDVDMSAAKLAAAAQLYADIVARDDLRGVVLLVARRGKIVLHEAYGFRDLAKKKPMRKGSLFRMASNSKAVTAAAILILADRGKLAVDDPVHRHLPAFDTPKSRRITIAHLMTHTSGLRIRPIFLSPLLQKSKANPDAPSLLAEVQRFGAIGAAVEPGTSYSYNNAGYNTLAGLVEKIAKQPFKDFVKANIYQPLGMKDCCNHESDADHSRMSAVFRRAGAKAPWRAGWQPGDAPDYPFNRGSGGMIATARDYAVFCQMFLDGGEYGGERVLSAKRARAATGTRTKHLKKPSRHYGYGWVTEPKTGVFSHGGSDGTWSFCDPKRELIGLVFTQSPRGGTNPKARFRELVIAACASRKPRK